AIATSAVDSSTSGECTATVLTTDSPNPCHYWISPCVESHTKLLTPDLVPSVVFDHITSFPKDRGSNNFLCIPIVYTDSLSACSAFNIDPVK
ncbi:hypothetical protein J6590_098734, partial [Homalodisca vitripennis]